MRNLGQNYTANMELRCGEGSSGPGESSMCGNSLRLQVGHVTRGVWRRLRGGGGALPAAIY